MDEKNKREKTMTLDKEYYEVKWRLVSMMDFTYYAGKMIEHSVEKAGKFEDLEKFKTKAENIYNEIKELNNEMAKYLRETVEPWKEYYGDR